MFISDVAIKRPVLATVVSLLVVVFGLVSARNLPLREYPDINPPIVTVTTNYVGASARIIESRVTRVIEEQIAGLEGIEFVSSESIDGQSNITVSFKPFREIDAAANDVRDRVSRSLDQLPKDIVPPQVIKVDANADVLIWFRIWSPLLNTMELTDYAERYIKDRFSTVDGVAGVTIAGGQRYAMRVWLDSAALASRNLTVADVERALLAENIEVPGGRIESQDREFTVRIPRVFRTAEDFQNLVVRRGDQGYLVRLREVARVEIAPEDNRSIFRSNGQDFVGLGLVRKSTANSLEVARAAKAEAQRISASLPPTFKLESVYDGSLFIEAALKEVYVTFGLTLAIVIAVIFLFLGSVRSMLIPAVTVPISVVGSFIALRSFGYSINLFTLLALVLAIGLLVDDAIVVLENIHRRVEDGEAPEVAAERGTRQVGFAVIATTAVLIAVLVPIAFLGGQVGRLFVEFAVTIASSVAISGIVALTLSPVMSARLLGRHKATWLTNRIDGVFRLLQRSYRWILHAALSHAGLVGLAYLLFAGAMVLLYVRVPTELAPTEDRGDFFLVVDAPQGASVAYMRKQLQPIERELMELVKKGEAAQALVGSPRGSSTDSMNNGFGLVLLAPWEHRKRSAQAITADVGAAMARHSGVRAFPIVAQGLSGWGSPVQMVIGGNSYEELRQWRDILLAETAKNPRLVGVGIDYEETKPQITITTDPARTGELGVPLSEIGQTLQTMFGSRRVTTYEDKGQQYNVILESDRRTAQKPQDLLSVYVRSARSGELIPLANLAELAESTDAPSLRRFDRMRAITLTAGMAAGYSLGEALSDLQKLVAKKLPSHAKIDYAGASREFKNSGNALWFVFGLALAVVLLVLAAQFESFVHPIPVMLTVPLAMLGALAGLFYFHSSLNVYSEIGIIMLIGLAAKNGILLVEFTNQLRAAEYPLREAIIEASALRLRPIAMTALATAAGAVPLVLARGAGAESRFTLGIVIFFGVTVATLLTLVITPVGYYLLNRRAEARRNPPP